MSEPIAYLNGRFVPASQCVLPVYDLGIVLGAADLLRLYLTACTGKISSRRLI